MLFPSIALNFFWSNTSNAIRGHDARLRARSLSRELQWHLGSTAL